MDEFLGKKYKLKTSENFDEYLKFIEVGLISRKTAGSVSPTTVLTRDANGTYTLTMSSAVRTVTMTFKLGEEFEEERADGVKVKAVMVLEGNKLIQTQYETNGRKSTHVREFTPEKLIVVSTADGWDGKCVRVYELVN